MLTDRGSALTWGPTLIRAKSDVSPKGGGSYGIRSKILSSLSIKCHKLMTQGEGTVTDYKGSHLQHLVIGLLKTK